MNFVDRRNIIVYNFADTYFIFKIWQNLVAYIVSVSVLLAIFYGYH